MAAGVASTSLAAIERRLVYPTLTPDEAVVADLVVTDKPHRADPTGRKDNTAILQRAINDLANAGGGVIYIPVGIYRFNGNLKVPGGISLRAQFGKGNRHMLVMVRLVRAPKSEITGRRPVTPNVGIRKWNQKP